MKRHFIFAILIILVLTTSACTATGIAPVPNGTSHNSVPNTPKRTSATPSPQPATTKTSVNHLTMNCSLLNSRDLASFFASHTEVMLPEPQISRVEHPIFSMQNAPGTETACDFYAFHLPGSSAEVMLQVNYWIDVPSPITSNKTWMQEWTQAKSEADQPLPGFGNDAFLKDGRLSVKKGNLYLTVEATETDLDLNSPTGVKKQISMEKQIAFVMLNRF